MRRVLLLALVLALGACRGAEVTDLVPGFGDDDDDGGGSSPQPSPSPGYARSGLNPGQPLDDLGGVHFEGERVHATGTGWVRVNFRLGPYSSVEDPAWQQAYGELVNDYVARGLQVYGLIGGESVASTGEVGDDAWLDDYAAAFVKIVDLFKDRVRVYESFNEPNNWIAPDTPAIPADRFAAVLERVYLETKVNAGHAADPAWQVSLVSGPLFAFDANDASAYLDEVYTAGRFSGAWDYVCATAGSFPLDGIGYHLYVREDAEATAVEVRDALQVTLAGMLAVADAHETACATASPKQAWISEVGWSAASAGEENQARNVTPLFEAYDADPRVAVFFWFTLQDFPDGYWGLYRDDGSPRPARDAFTAANVSAMSAQPVSVGP